MTKAARYVFAALVVATFAAFFVAQRLKNGPTLVQGVKVFPYFSPNGDGRLDRERIRFRLEEPDDVTVDVIDARGDRVKRLTDNRPLPGYREIFLRWDGRRDDGTTAPDGRYRIRVSLRRDGRSFNLADRVFVKDTVPPPVRVTQRFARPQLLPLKDGVTVSFTAPARRKKVSVFRTYPGPVQRVAGPVELGAEAKSWRWDGTNAAGKRLRPGTYVAVVEARDAAGNIGTSVPMTGAGDARRPVIRDGQNLRASDGKVGRGGITIRYLGVQPPPYALPAGRTATFNVDARGEPYAWSLRRAGGATVRRSRGTTKDSRLQVPIPSGESGLYVLTVRSGSHVDETVVPVRSTTAGARVLVVLPYITWQGTNPVDENGDGAIDTLARGVGIRVGVGSKAGQRVMVGDGSGLPFGVGSDVAPELAYLDRRRHRYDLTTDLALLNGAGPKLSDYRGVLIAGQARWLPPALGRTLIAYVRGGGTLASLGTASLRAQAEPSGSGNRLVNPTPVGAEDIFGTRFGSAVEGLRQPITAIEPDRLTLFENGTGEFAGYDSAEPTASAGDKQTVLSKATLQDGRAVIVGARYGRGVLIRTGLPGIAAKLRDDRNTQALMERIWTRLSR